MAKLSETEGATTGLPFGADTLVIPFLVAGAARRSGAAVPQMARLDRDGGRGERVGEGE